MKTSTALLCSRRNVTPEPILYCTTNCIPIILMFQENYRTNTQFGTACPIEQTADREELSELPIGATIATRTRSGTSVSRRSSQVFHYVVGRADSQLIAIRHSCEGKGCNTLTIRRCRIQRLLMMTIQITHKQEKGTHILSQYSSH